MSEIHLPQDAENTRHAPHVFHHHGRGQLVPLARWPVAAVPVAPEGQERGQRGVGKQFGILLARGQGREIEQDFVGLLP